MTKAEYDAAVAAVSDPLERVRVAHALKPMLGSETPSAGEIADRNAKAAASMPADFQDPLGRDVRHWAMAGFGGL